MVDSGWLRLMATVLLATWSPAQWCCCQGQAAESPSGDAGALAAAGSTDCHVTACCSETASVPLAAAGPAPAPGCGCGPINPDERPSCRCVHGPSDVTLPVATNAPPPGNKGRFSVDLLAELSNAVTHLRAIGSQPANCRGSPRRVPAHSLYSIRCQLTT